MAADDPACPERDVLAYPPHMLYVDEARITIGARYRQVWMDGFGARGWKLNSTLDDPEIIASTRETGSTIATSVFVHDVLDHLLSGFRPSGHRAEAMALTQLRGRTGSDIDPDFEQMAREDLLAGRVLGEPMHRFLGTGLTGLTDADPEDPRALVDDLRARLGEHELVRRLVLRFRALGDSGQDHALRSWKRLGLPRARRARLGLALQYLLEQADRYAEARELQQAEARILILPKHCSLALATPGTTIEFSSAL
ncbi:hypothetical protein [Thioalkalivibrio thiocyanodenitrificans]|uniref:hypothetical protein n=1 Tax=Thioalkalivibrio thiocyanodenitrificans TaxID=243063 RepID=UPI00037EA7ED|nr:hypothetical protein [Thioalkalivibrio thiocyanodenitrificans]